jgi:hypothetical protein
MTDKLVAKPIVTNKFWVVEQGGVKVGTLHKKDNNKFLISNCNGQTAVGKKDDIIQAFGKEFFKKPSKPNTSVSFIEVKDVYGYPSHLYPCNPMFDIQRKLPLFTKNVDSKSVYCAGYYAVKFNKRWVRIFCPKLITLERYQYFGPFKTEQEAKSALSNVNDH